MVSLGERFSGRDDGVLVTMELSPDNKDDSDDDKRFQRDIFETHRLLTTGIIDAFTTNSLPQFHEDDIQAIRFLGPHFLKLIGCDDDTIEGILMEVTRRTSSINVPDLGDIESCHIRTIAIQNRSRQHIVDLMHLHDFKSGAAFIVSGGHPLRKLIAFIEKQYPAIPLSPLRYILLDNYDSTLAVQDLQIQSPGTVPLVAWNPGMPSDLDRLAQKAQIGAKSVLTQPASFLPKIFTQALQALRNNQYTKNLRVQVGIPFIGSAKSLKKWFFLMGISPETHAEAGFLLEAFQKAEQDRRLTFFADTWTRNCLEWALSLAGADGVHYMPHALNPRTKRLIEDARGLGKNSTGMDVLLASKKELIDWQIRYDTLRPRVGLHYLSGMIESTKKKDYSAEFLPLLESTYDVICNLQKRYPNHDFWNNFSVNFLRMPQNNHAHALPFEIINDEADSFRELAIDVRYPAYTIDPNLFKKRLQENLIAALEKKPLSSQILIGEHAAKYTFLDDALNEGWNEFSHAQKAANQNDIGTSIAKNTIVYERSAKEFFECLKNAPDGKDYAVAELGVYDANGIPEMLKHLVSLIEADGNPELLKAKLKRTVFVCVDCAQDGLDSCKKVLDQHAELRDMFQEFQYIKGDIMDDDCHGQLDPWKKQFLFIRAINTLDASPERTYVMRNGTPYRIEFDTVYDTTDLKKLVADLYLPVVIKSDKKGTHLTYFIDGKEQPPLPLRKVTEEHILLALKVAESSEHKKIDSFIPTLVNESGIPREAALLIWNRVLHILKKKKRFATIQDAAEEQLARDVASHHPDPRVPFALSYNATGFMNHLGSFLNQQSGTAFFTNLTSSISSQHLASHHSSQGPATPGLTASYPVQPEPIVNSFVSNGLQLHVVPHKEHPKSAKPLPSTVSMILVKHGEISP